MAHTDEGSDISEVLTGKTVLFVVTRKYKKRLNLLLALQVIPG